MDILRTTQNVDIAKIILSTLSQIFSIILFAPITLLSRVLGHLSLIKGTCSMFIFYFQDDEDWKATVKGTACHTISTTPRWLPSLSTFSTTVSSMMIIAIFINVAIGSSVNLLAYEPAINSHPYV